MCLSECDIKAIELFQRRTNQTSRSSMRWCCKGTTLPAESSVAHHLTILLLQYPSLGTQTTTCCFLFRLIRLIRMLGSADHVEDGLGVMFQRPCDGEERVPFLTARDKLSTSEFPCCFIESMCFSQKTASSVGFTSRHLHSSLLVLSIESQLLLPRLCCASKPC